MKFNLIYRIFLISVFLVNNSQGQNQAGALDTTFSLDGKISISDFPQYNAQNSAINCIKIQNDGKIITGGYEDLNLSITRYNSNGTLDSSFGINGFLHVILIDSLGLLESEINGIALQNDGKIVAAGSAKRLTNSTFFLGRYLSNGSPDSTFGLNGQIIFPFNFGFSEPKKIEIQSDGKIVVGGYSKANSTLDYGVVRLNIDGSFDTSFNSTGKLILDLEGGLDRICDLAILGNGKILLGGFVERPLIQPNSSYFGLVQLNPNGSLDSLFGTNGINKDVPFSSINYKNCLGVNSQGKILAAGGGFDFFNIIQFNTDGSIDTGFGNNGQISINPTFTLTQDVANVLLIQQDDKILVGGNSLVIVGTPNTEFTIIRCNPDGSLDPSFDYDGKLNINLFGGGIHDIHAMAIQSNGKILAAGKTPKPPGLFCQGVCRLLGDCQPGNFSNSISLCAGESLQVGNSTYDSAGVYLDVLQGYSGCDSLVNTYLQYLPNIEIEQDHYIFPGDSILIGNHYFSDYGTYIDTLSSSNGCDSVIISNLFLITDSRAYSDSKNKFEARPNPFSQQLIISGLEKDGLLLIFDSQGKRILQYFTYSENLDLDLSFLSAGCYFVQYIGRIGTETLRLAKDFD